MVLHEDIYDKTKQGEVTNLKYVLEGVETRKVGGGHHGQC